MSFLSIDATSRDHVRHWLASMRLRHRKVIPFFRLSVREWEREDSPVDPIGPPKIPELIQPYYQSHEIESILKRVGNRSEYALRDAAVILTLCNSGITAVELVSMQVKDVDLPNRSIKVVGISGKERWVCIDYKTATAIDRYLLRRYVNSEWLWLTTGEKEFFSANRLRMMLERRAQDAHVRFLGINGFRRAFAIGFLLRRYTKLTPSDQAMTAHKKLRPVHRLDE